MTKVVLSGYYGFDNLGDEAVLYSILGLLRELSPGMAIEVLSHNPRRTTELYRVAAGNRWRLAEVRRAIREADLLISGGGSLLQDVTGLKSLIYYLGVIRLARWYGKPVVFYAQGIGPVRSKLGRLLMRRLVNRVEAITVRDESSRQDLLELGVNQPPVTVTADPVLGLDPAQVDRAVGQGLLARYGLDLSGQHPLVGISVREWQGLKEFKQVLAGVCDQLAGQGWQVVFIPMQHSADLAPSREVAALMQKPAVVLADPVTVPEVASLIAGLDMLIGMRLHALILAAVLSVPPVAVSYDPKIDRFMKRIGLNTAIRVDCPDSEGIMAAVKEILLDPAAFKNALAAYVTPLKRLSRQSGQIVMDMLQRRGKILTKYDEYSR